MIRADIIAAVGREYLVSNIENDEFSYPKAFRAASLTFVPIQNDAGRTYGRHYPIPQRKPYQNLLWQ